MDRERVDDQGEADPGRDAVDFEAQPIAEMPVHASSAACSAKPIAK